MRYHISPAIQNCQFVTGRYLAVDSGEHRFTIPLHQDSRQGRRRRP